MVTRTKSNGLYLNSYCIKGIININLTYYTENIIPFTGHRCTGRQNKPFFYFDCHRALKFHNASIIITEFFLIKLEYNYFFGVEVTRSKTNQ